jgi:hypothetical protein
LMLIWGATFGRNFDVNIGRAAWQTCSATWNLGTNSAFALGPRKTTEKLVLIIFKHSVLTSKETQPITITRITWSVLFEEIIVVHTVNHMKPINTLCWQNDELLILKAGGTYSYH